jgi:hypothetical protein
MQAPLDVEGEEGLLLLDGVVVGCFYLSAHGRICNLARSSHHAELVVYFFRWVAVQHVPTVAPKIGTLGRGHDESVGPVRCDDRTDGMQPRSTVLSDSCQKPQSYTELVKEPLALHSQFGGHHLELSPTCHFCLTSMVGYGRLLEEVFTRPIISQSMVGVAVLK